MENGEIIDRLNEIQREVYSKGLTKELKGEWSLHLLTLKMRGFCVKKHKNPFIGTIWELKDLNETKANRNAKFVCEWDNVDMSPNHKHLKGNCTTRAMAYVLRGIMDYDTIEAEQYRLAEIKNRSSYHITYHRNTRGVWEGVVLDRGYEKLYLRKPIRSDKIASILRGICEPMIYISSRHAAVIHNGKVVDSWDSRGKRVKELLVKEENVEEVKRILGIF